jgi:16S rRNA U516 pseudouridylate synthase RsuA-like enzyme
MRVVVVAAIATFLLSLTTPILVDAYSSGRPSTTLQQIILHASSSFQRRNQNTCLLAFLENNQEEKEEGGIRLNKVFKATHSRRAADSLILSGRVTVNGVAVENKGGFKVIPFVDEVAVDSKLVEGWEALNGFVVAASPPQEGSTTSTSQPPKRRQQQSEAEAAPINTDAFEYVKYWKPRGVTCTTDRSIRDNIIDAILDDGYRPRHRVYPVGRLDKDTSGKYVRVIQRQHASKLIFWFGLPMH